MMSTANLMMVITVDSEGLEFVCCVSLRGKNKKHCVSWLFYTQNK